MKIPLVDLKAQYNSIKDEINNAISNIVESSRFIGGEELELFEKEFASYCKKKFVIGTSSGTAALHLTLLSLLKKGDEVTTVPNTFTATAAAIHHAGGKINFVDVNEYYLIDISKLEKTSSNLIIPVHLYGQPADMDEIKDFAEDKNIIIVEDAAQAHGAKYKGKKIPITETGIFSFFPAKPLGAYGDAGCVATDNEELAERVKQLRDHGRANRTKNKYEHSLIGFNYRLDAIQAAILRVKLKYLDKWNEMKNRNAKLYNKLLSEIDEVETPKVKPYNNHSYYVYVIRTEKRDELREFLLSNGISTGIHYPIPLHLQKAYRFLGYKEGDFPVAERYAKEILSLPIYPELTEDQIIYVCNKIKEFFRR